MRNHHYIDREDAASQLASALARFKGRRPLVLAIPRGGAPIGRIVADALDGELDVVLVHKLGAPGNPEFAIGAVDERGSICLNERAERAGADDAYLRDESATQLARIRARRAYYGGGQASFDPVGRDVIVVDDGLATGATMGAALQAVRARRPARLICAVPVAAPAGLRRVTPLADEIVCLATPTEFRSVGQCYDHFAPVDDDEVMHLLDRSRTSVAAVPASARMVRIRAGDAELEGELCVPMLARGIVVFAHGSGSSRLSPRNRFMAAELNRVRLATLLLDLLTPDEDLGSSSRFDLALLAERLGAAVEWLGRDPDLHRLPIGLFGTSTGAAAALLVADAYAQRIAAVVSRGGRADLVDKAVLARLRAPVLLIVGEFDREVLELNRRAWTCLPDSADLVVVPGATHLFEEPLTLEQVAQAASDWFEHWLQDACFTAHVTPPRVSSRAHPAPRDDASIPTRPMRGR